MFEEFIPLPVVTLATGTSILQPLHALPERVTPESPAVDSMTDLRHASAVLVRAGDTVAHARERMRNRGVRMLFCVDISGHIEGLVTLNDMLGERPVQAAQQGGMPVADLLVRDIMTPRIRLEAFRIEDVLHARVGHVLASLRSTGRQHALVVETLPGGVQAVRGVFSATQIERQLGARPGAQTPPLEVARTFAEIEASLAH
ncbi:MAG: CBS domain-containing protein [Burkholderiales bacterium]|jgi:CBS domain containing-hemolysin-like protein|nr:CBS domain-containing protein [Burkholderiales bacterium]